MYCLPLVSPSRTSLLTERSSTCTCIYLGHICFFLREPANPRATSDDWRFFNTAGDSIWIPPAVEWFWGRLYPTPSVFRPLCLRWGVCQFYCISRTDVRDLLLHFWCGNPILLQIFCLWLLSGKVCLFSSWILELLLSWEHGCCLRWDLGHVHCEWLPDDAISFWISGVRLPLATQTRIPMERRILAANYIQPSLGKTGSSSFQTPPGNHR